MEATKWAGMAIGSIVLVIVILASLEAARRRQIGDPVTWLANMLSPPASGGAAGGAS